MSNVFSRIKDISVYTPENILTNSELSSIYPEWSEEKSSIRQE